jgi:aryl-alcohol dehydrogenase-like predicted oxidoreductase
MRYLDVSGERLSVVGLGTWQFGSTEWGYGHRYDEVEAARIVHRALDLGVNVFDTAEIYGKGASETILGKALSGNRERAFVATKFLPVLPLPGTVVGHGLRSKERLAIDHIDLFQVHWPPPHAPSSFTMRGMRRLRDLGVIRHVGVSNHSLKRWRRAEQALGEPVLSNQVQFNLISRKAATDLVPFAQTNGRIVIAYSPLAQGLLSGNYTASNPVTGFRSRNIVNPLSSARNLVRAKPLFDALRDIASAHGATPAQVALAWVISHPNVIAIPGAHTVQQMELNVAAADLVLTDDDLARLSPEPRLRRIIPGWILPS